MVKIVGSAARANALARLKAAKLEDARPGSADLSQKSTQQLLSSLLKRFNRGVDFNLRSENADLAELLKRVSGQGLAADINGLEVGLRAQCFVMFEELYKKIGEFQARAMKKQECDPDSPAEEIAIVPPEHERQILPLMTVLKMEVKEFKEQVEIARGKDFDPKAAARECAVNLRIEKGKAGNAVSDAERFFASLSPKDREFLVGNPDRRSRRGK